ncbi:hypothetical protein BGW80DRAFT_1320489, partial [Lactifluus volemus]
MIAPLTELHLLHLAHLSMHCFSDLREVENFIARHGETLVDEVVPLPNGDVDLGNFKTQRISRVFQTMSSGLGPSQIRAEGSQISGCIKLCLPLPVGRGSRAQSHHRGPSAVAASAVGWPSCWPAPASPVCVLIDFDYCMSPFPPSIVTPLSPQPPSLTSARQSTVRRMRVASYRTVCASRSTRRVVEGWCGRCGAPSGADLVV